MKLFSDCSSKCVDCIRYYRGGCLAGHGDDDFSAISDDDAKKLLRETTLPLYKIDQLKKKLGN